MRLVDGVVLDLLENPVEADDNIETVHYQTDADEADQRDLIVAEPASDPSRPVDPWNRRWRWARELVIPRDAGKGSARYAGSKEIIEGECKRG